MSDKNIPNRKAISFIFVLLFILLRTLFALIWDTATTISQPEVQPPSNSDIWQNTLIAMIMGAVAAILFSTLKAQFSKLDFQAIIVSTNAIFLSIEGGFKKTITNLKKWLTNLWFRAVRISNILLSSILKIFLFIVALPLIPFVIVIFLLILLIQLIRYFVIKLIKWNADSLAQKWYNGKGVIEPGLIEVSIGIMAAVIAIPALVETEPSNYDIYLNILRTICIAITMFTSLYFIELYAREKGFTSDYSIAVSLKEGGPFFWLTWLILLGSISAIIPFWLKN